MGFALPLSKLAGVETVGFSKMHSLLSLLRECFLKFFRIPTPFLEKHVSVFCSFWQFPLPLSKNQGVVFTKTSLLHSPFQEIREWVLQKQAFYTSSSQKAGEWSSTKQASSTLRVECRLSVIVGAGMVGPAMPLRRTPWLATLSGSEDRANIEANDLARHPQFLSPDTLT